MIFHYSQFIVASFVALLPGFLKAQQADPSQIPRTQSLLLLDMPSLNNAREFYQYFGWNSSFSVETSYAATVPTIGLVSASAGIHATGRKRDTLGSFTIG